MVKRQNGVEGGGKACWDEILQEGAKKGEGDIINSDRDENDDDEQQRHNNNRSSNS